jgi:DNA repair exonuclease SbcCD nuclease subunit
MFRPNKDVIPGRAIPHGFAAVLAGHIHRHQVLKADLSGRSIAAPVFYPGSTQRTSAAECGEAKGYVTLAFEPAAEGTGSIRGWTFHPLPDVPFTPPWRGELGQLRAREGTGVASRK